MHEKCVAHHAEIRKMVPIHPTRVDELASASMYAGRAQAIRLIFLRWAVTLWLSLMQPTRDGFNELSSFGTGCIVHCSISSAQIGDFLRNRVGALKEEDRDDFSVVLGATLTLMGLLIGFSFSMAVSRYDQRKNYEEAETNAIGTEYVRADLLPGRRAIKSSRAS